MEYIFRLNRSELFLLSVGLVVIMVLATTMGVLLGYHFSLVKLEQGLPKADAVSPKEAVGFYKLLAPSEEKVASPSATVAPTKKSTPGNYAVQLASFKVEQQAITLQEKLQRVGYPVTISTVNLPQKGRYYRVQLRGLTSLAEAKKKANELEKKEGLKGLIVRNP